MWLHFQNVWTQWKLGVIGDDVWQGYRNVIRDDLVGTDGELTWWRDTHKYALSSEFSILVESCH